MHGVYAIMLGGSREHDPLDEKKVFGASARTEIK